MTINSLSAVLLILTFNDINTLALPLRVAPYFYTCIRHSFNSTYILPQITHPRHLTDPTLAVSSRERSTLHSTPHSLARPQFDQPPTQSIITEKIPLLTKTYQIFRAR